MTEPLERVWEALARLEAGRRTARVEAALLSLGARQLRTDLSQRDALLDAAATVAEAEDASLQASECAELLEQSRRGYLADGISADQMDLAALQAWAQTHWGAAADPRAAMLLHWLRAPWDDAQDLAVTIVQMIRRVEGPRR